MKLQSIFAERKKYAYEIFTICERVSRHHPVLILGLQQEALLEKSQIGKGQGQVDTPLRGDTKGRRKMPG